MKRKLLLALIALTCALCLIFALAGCNPAENQSGIQQGGVKPHTHNYVYKCSQTEHWQACTVCGEEKDRGVHTVSDGVCPACGYVEKCTEGLEFTEIKENKEIIGYEVSNGTATDSHIFIPSFYNNLPVISINPYVREKYTSLENITIGKNVIEIGGGAFWGCESLKEITIPDSVTSIDNVAFSYCKNLTQITVPASVTSIGNSALFCCESLTEITIPNSVSSIGNNAFFGCLNIKEITIGNSITSIGNNAFLDCTSLESITVDKGNKVYRSEGNCLIETETKTVIAGCKTSKIPDSVNSIGREAFCYISLTEITIPTSVASIGYGAFSYCESLTEIIISQGVTSIDSNAFYGCTSLERVIFENTAGWKVSYHSDMSNPEEINVENPEQNAKNLNDKYSEYYWKRDE